MDRTVKSIFRKWSNIFSPAARKSRPGTSRRRTRLHPVSGEYLEDRTLLAVNTFAFNLGSSTPGDIDIFSDTAAGEILDLLTQFNVTTGSSLDSGFAVGGIDIRAVPGENNQPPVAEDDALATDQGVVLMANVFAPNPTVPDSDPNTGSVVADDDNIAVVSINGSTTDVGAVVPLGSGSVVTVFENGDLLFTPDAALGNLPEGAVVTDTFTYTIADSFGVTDTANVTIDIIGRNDAPMIGDATFTISETAANMSSVGTPASSDPDTGDMLTYSITGGNTGNAFTIDPSTGEIVVNDTTSIDFEVATSYALRIEVSDGELTDVATATVMITDVEPMIADQTFNTDEDSLNGTSVGTVALQPPPANDINSVVFSITAGDSAGAFEINDSTGEITVADTTAIDFEVSDTFALTVQVTDDEGTTTDTATVTVNINDIAPVLSDQSFSVNEDAANATSVGTVALDLPPGSDINSVTFAITGGDPGLAFAINATTGEITVADTTAIDFAVSDTFALTVEATGDGGATTESATVTVNVIDYVPMVSDQAFSIDEDAADSGSVGVVALDVPPSNGLSLVDFSIIAGNSGGAFAINSITGEITIADTDAIDFEVSNSFALTVQVTDDGGMLTDTATVTVNVFDTEPTVSDQTFAVNEDATNGSSVGVVALDALAGDDVNSVVFSITAGNTGGAFAIHSATGELTVADTTAIDFEVSSTFALTVQVTDDGGATTDTATITVNVNDLEPMVSNQTFNVDEDAADGTIVDIVALDQTPGSDINSVTFEIIGGNTGSAFAIDSSTGEISVASTMAIDFEMSNSFALTVQVTDDAGATTDTATITVNINDIEPLISDQSFGVTEDAANGSSVGTVALNLPPGSDLNSVTFSIVGGNTGSAFTIDINTGEITVNNTTAIDFEASSAFALTVQVTDDGGATTDTATVTVNVSNVAPMVSNQVFSVNEDATDSTSVGTVVLNMPPGSDINSIDFAITAGNTGDAFTINSSTGEITVADTTAIDFEVSNSFALTVQVTDDGGATTDTATVTISVTDVEPMLTDQLLNVDETAANGTSVGTVVVDLPPGSDSNSVNFSITAGNTDNAFAINAATGEVTVADTTAVDFEVMSSFGLTVQVTDDGGTTTDSATITVDINDIPPMISDQSFSVDEDAANGTSIGTALVDTGPLSDANSVEYSITAGNTGGAFAINMATGEITVADTTAVDFEASSSFALTVQVMNNGSVVNDTATVTVNVNDIEPMISDQTFSVSEGVANATSVGTVALDLPPGNDINSVNFSITGGNSGNAFAINASTGEITVTDTTAIDFEVSNVFGLTVRVTDDGGTTADTAVITIDINDAVLSLAPQSFSLPENATNGSTVGTVLPTGDMNSVSFAITAGNDAGIFAINASTGELTLTDTSMTDFEVLASQQFMLTVTVTGDAGATTDSATVTINVTDVAPMVVVGQMFSVDENAANATSVGTVSRASTEDINSIEYSITANNTNGAFAIDPNTGEITVANATAIDFETMSSFALDVTLTDGTNIDTTVVTVNVNNQAERVDLSVDTNTATESGATVVTVTATAEGSAVTGTQTIDLSVVGTGVAGSDYVLSGTQITIADGTNTGSVTFTIVNDLRLEGDETATLSIANPTSGLVLGTTASQAVSIEDNELGLISIAMDQSAVEGSSQMLTATLTIMAGGSSGTVGLDTDLMVDVRDLGTGSATSGVDYSVFPTQTLTFFAADGASLGSTFTAVAGIGDAIVEDNETVLLQLENIANDLSGQVSIVDADHIATLNNDDAATLTINNQSITESDANQVVTFTVTLDSAVQDGFMLDFASALGTAEGTDFTVDTSTPLSFAGTASETQTISVTVIGDDIVEVDEAFMLNLGNVSGTSPGQFSAITSGAIGTATVINDDTATLTIDDVTTAEGTGGGPTNFVFTVTLDSEVEDGLDLAYVTSDGTATTAGGDYSLSSGTLNFAGTASETQMITVAVAHDAIVEADETFTVLLGALSGIDATAADDITVQSSGGDGVITNDDSASLAINDVTMSEVAGGATTDYVFTVTLDNDVQDGLTLAYATNDGTATAASGDYTDNDGSLNFTGAAGETQTVTVTVSDDQLVETNETFAVILGALSAIDATASDDITVQATGGDGVITNDDSANITINDVTLVEGSGGGPTNFIFTVSLDNGVQDGLTVAYTTNDGTATSADTDYIDNDGSLSFAGTTGETQTITVAVPHDSTVEPDETFAVLLGALSGVDATQAASISVQATGGDAVITNDDAVSVEFSGAAASDTENSGGNLPVVQYSGTIQTGHTVDIDVLVTGGTAEGADFTAPGTITLTGDGIAKVNQSAGSGAFVITSDAIVEADETVILGFDATPANVTPAGTIAHTYTITNDDTANLTISDSTMTEGAGGASTDFIFTVSLDNNVEDGLTVAYTTNDGTATVANSDYLDNDGTLTFAGTGGETQTVTVSVSNDSIVEPDEAFTVLLGVLSSIDLTAADDILVQSTGGDGTITNDDAIDVQFNVAADSDGEDSGSNLPSVLYSGTIQTGHTVDIDVTVDGGTATTNTDFTAPGTITVTGDGLLHTNTNVGSGLLAIAGDTIVEANESIVLGLNGTPVNVNPTAVTAHTYTIVNDDNANLMIGDVQALEGTGDTTSFVFTVKLDNAVQDGLDLAFATGNMTAVSGSDYTANSGTLTFSGTVGETETITVDVASDTVVEADEVFNVMLGALSNVAATAADDINVQVTAATGTITNDDTASITVGDVTMAEGAGGGSTNFVFTVTLDNDVQGGFMLPYTTNDGTATTSDYTDNDNTLAFGGTSGEAITITVAVQDNTVVEADETFAVQLGTLTGVDSTAADDITVQSAAATGTIINDDTAMLQINDVSATEGTGGGPTNLTFTITLTNAVQDGLTVNYTSDDQTATAGVDFIDMDSTVNFAGTVGETQTVTVQVLHDSIVEADEMFRVRPGSLTNVDPTAADDIMLPAAGGIGTITNDDTANITINNVMSTEGTGGGTTSFTFTATLDNAVQDGLQLVYSTADGTAVAGSDFVGVSGGTVNFAGTQGESQTLTVIGTHDGIVEADETFAVTLDSLAMIDMTAADDIMLQPGGGGTATIQNDDAIDVQFNVASASDVENTGGNLPAVQYSGTIQSGHMVSIPVTVTGGTATSVVDFTAPGSITVGGDGVLHTNEAVGIGALAIAMDAIVEGDETIALGFDAAVGDINPTGTTAHTYTITNDDTATVTIGNDSVTEGTGAGTTITTFTVTLNAQVQDGFNLAFTTDDVTALAGSDYVDADGSLSFTGLMNEIQTVTVVINRDAAVEADETFAVTLGALTPNDAGVDTADVTFSGSPGTGTITDDDGATLTISGVTVTEGTGAGTTEATFTVNLDNPVEGGFDVAFTTNDGTAVAGTDYTDNDASVTFAGNANENQTITVVINRDSEVEGDEAFTVALGTITPAGVGVNAGDISTSGSPATGAITDDDTATLTISNVSVTEGTGGGPTQATFTVNLNNPVKGGLALAFTTNDGTALSTSDYTDNDDTLTFVGTASENQTITVDVTQDALVEADETFTVALGAITLNDPGVAPVDVTVSGSPATGTITNDDGATLTIGSPVAMGEGTGGGTSGFVFPVTLNEAVDGGFTIAYTTNDGTATLASGDYVNNDSSLTFLGNMGEVMNITVAVNHDSIVEADETFNVTLGAISGLSAGVSAGDITVSGSPATGTINNDDVATLTVGSPMTLEAAGSIAIPVTLSNAVQGGLNIDFATGDAADTATAGVDYVATSTTLNFTNATTMNVLVTINDDSIVEFDEVFTATLSSLSVLGAGVDAGDITVSAPGTATILNDETAFVRIEDMAVLMEGDAGMTPFVFMVELRDAAGTSLLTASEDITVTANTADNTATIADSDYIPLATNLVVTIPAGSSSAIITVDVNGDVTIEPDETFFVDLTNVQFAGSTDLSLATFLVGFDQGIGSIVNDD